MGNVQCIRIVVKFVKSSNTYTKLEKELKVQGYNMENKNNHENQRLKLNKQARNFPYNINKFPKQQ